VRAHVLVLYEPGRNGAATLAVAAEFVTRFPDTHLAVVALGPQDTERRGCVVYSDALNAAVREQASRELIAARQMLGALAQRATFESLSGQRDAVARRLAAGSAWGLVLLPARGLHYRLPFGAGGRLRRAAGCEVRIVRAAARRRRPRGPHRFLPRTPRRGS
jgi:hypothetical protein